MWHVWPSPLAWKISDRSDISLWWAPKNCYVARLPSPLAWKSQTGRIFHFGGPKKPFIFMLRRLPFKVRVVPVHGSKVAAPLPPPSPRPGIKSDWFFLVSSFWYTGNSWNSPNPANPESMILICTSIQWWKVDMKALNTIQTQSLCACVIVIKCKEYTVMAEHTTQSFQ